MKFLIVDDHAVVREGVAAVLQQAFELATVFHASDIATAIATADSHPDLDAVLLDLAMPGVSGMAALAAFGSRHPAIPAIVLSSSEAESDVRGAIANGALGYVAKSARSTTLVAALRLVLGGETYVPPFMARNGSIDAQPGLLAGLTERQRDVLKLVASEATNKEIAHHLALSEKTVKAHLTAIFRSLNVANRIEAVRAAGLRHA